MKQREGKKRKQWDPANTTNDVKIVRVKPIGLQKPSKLFNMTRITSRTLSVNTDSSPCETTKILLGRRSVLKKTEQTVEYLLLIENPLFELTRKESSRLVCQL
jgi:hypothetical protein